MVTISNWLFILTIVVVFIAGFVLGYDAATRRI